GVTEEQFVVYRYANDAAKPLYITGIVYDEQSREYKRQWDAPTAATRSETISLFTQDLIGDRINCVIVSGMNNQYEHTITVFRRNSFAQREQPYTKIAELQIDGSIVIQETSRSMAYQQGITSGQSFNIAAYGHDTSSTNIMDQLETIYSYNPGTNQYERTNVSRIPGAQIEQRRVREILSGAPGVFENFTHDLWYYVSPQGMIDLKQYIFFDPASREIIFFGDEAQQVFRWQNSMPTRYGLYVRSQNISITTLLRFIDIELESLDSIKLRVFEDVRMKVIVNTSWDGTYRRAGAVNAEKPKSSIKASLNALFDSSLGRLQFFDTGVYTINSGEKSGHYVFFKVDENDLLELRPDDAGEAPEGRTVYKVEVIGNSALILSRVRLGTTGIHEVMEPAVMLTPVE
ncbi:MAG: pallilysin-related adhesin, partial [Treponema sp.]|nr:pallilysin-related adhesin [Treponema sp.]